MKLSLLKRLPACFFLFIVSACQAQDNTHPLLHYSSGNDTFVLEKECVKTITLIKPSDHRIAIDPVRLRFNIENRPLCTEQFNTLSAKNIGQQLVVSFNGKVISNDKIVSPLRISGNFSQGVNDLSTAKEIITSYQN